MRKYLTLIVAFFALSHIIQAQTSPKEFPNIKIENFGQMDERYYRGAQPAEGDYQALKDLGINTVIDLRKDAVDYEKKDVEQLGMKYINIPMTGWTTKDESVAEFMNILNDPASGTVYVHCAAGKHRTGLVSAIYRLEKYGWDYDTAYKEMKNYGYYSGFFHRKIKSYVKDYYKKFGAEKAASIRASIATAAAGGQIAAASAQGNQ